MLIFAKDRKTTSDCKVLKVTKNFGKKDEKFAIVGSISSEAFDAIVLALYPDEKTALLELERLYEAFEGGATAYKL